MVRLYDYVVPVADAASEIPNLREALADLPTADRKTLLTSLFKPERMPGSMERLTTLVVDVDASFGDLLTVLDNASRERTFVAIDEARPILDQYLPPTTVTGTRSGTSPASTSRMATAPTTASCSNGCASSSARWGRARP